MAFVTHSCAQRRIVRALSASTGGKSSGTWRWIVGCGIAATRAASEDERSVASSLRRRLTTERTSASVVRVSARAVSRESVPCGTAVPRSSAAASRFSDRALRWWPRTSWSSRAMCRRSAARLPWIASSRVASSSRLARASSSRAALALRMRCAARTAKACSPASASVFANQMESGIECFGWLKEKGTMMRPKARVCAAIHVTTRFRLRICAASQATKTSGRPPRCDGHQRLTKTTETLATTSSARIMPRRSGCCRHARAEAAMPVMKPTTQTQRQ